MITLKTTSHDDDAIRVVEIARHDNGNTAFCITTTFPDHSGDAVFNMLLTPRATILMAAALEIGTKDVTQWPGYNPELLKKHDTTAPAPGQEGGE